MIGISWILLYSHFLLKYVEKEFKEKIEKIMHDNIHSLEEATEAIKVSSQTMERFAHERENIYLKVNGYLFTGEWTSAQTGFAEKFMKKNKSFPYRRIKLPLFLIPSADFSSKRKGGERKNLPTSQ